MKTYSIGRDLNCDIVVNDSTDVISRRHALLNVTSSGKMTIIDQSSNGTYVNGIRISQNVPVPVTRKDIISFAHIAKLDWNQVPKSNQWIKYLIGAVALLAVILAVIFGVKAIKGNSGTSGEPSSVEVSDSTLIKQQEQARPDSVKNVERQDSISKAIGHKAGESTKAKKPTETKKPGSAKPEAADKPNGKESPAKDNSKGSKDKDKSHSKKRTIG